MSCIAAQSVRVSPAETGQGFASERPIYKETTMPINVEPAVNPPPRRRDAPAAIDFYVKAFGRRGNWARARSRRQADHAAGAPPTASMSCSTTTSRRCAGAVDDSDSLGGTPVTIHLTVTDVDSKFQRALDAGRHRGAPLDDQFWETRYGRGRRPRSVTTGRWDSRYARSVRRRSKRPMSAQAG